MSTLKLKGSTSGYVELTAPATAGDNTITLPTTAGTVAVKDASNNVEVGTGVTIGSPSSNVFTVSTNGSERVRVGAAGSVGIGVTNPQSDLYIGNADGASRSIVIHTQNNGAARLRFREGSTVLSGFNEYSLGMVGNANALTFEMQGSGEVLRVLDSGGLTFNGDTATANALDDYEEGTFTATFNGSSTTATGYYTKIGRLVHVLVYGSGLNVTSSVTAHIFGLPFTVQNNYSVAAVTHNTYTTNNGGNAYFSVSSTQMTCVTANSITNSNTNINGNAYIMISGCYETDT